jgi:hypothetical protein
MDFTVGKQIASSDIHTNGGWRGMWDVTANTWGGGDMVEGGQSNMYSG